MVLLVLLAVPVAVATAPPPFLTTDLVGSGAIQTTIGGFPGVRVNYTNTYSVGISVFVLLDLTNSAGQTVFVAVTYLPLGANSTGTAFIPIAGARAPAAGTYTAFIFATTDESVPVSGTTTLKVVL